MRELFDVSGLEPGLQLAIHLVLVPQRIDQPLGDRLLGQERTFVERSADFLPRFLAR